MPVTTLRTRPSSHASAPRRGVGEAGLAAYACVMVPGWHGSGAEHWQRRWLPGLTAAVVAEQADWERPTVANWTATLERTLRGLARPVVLIAHSLGCIAVAHWAERFGGGRVAGALLVAPADAERAGAPAALAPFAPIPRRPLPFPSLVVASSNDPASDPARSAGLAGHWGSRFICLPDAGHINVDSGHGDWAEGLELLESWVRSLR